MVTEVVSLRIMVGPASAHSVTVVEAVTVTLVTVVVRGGLVMVVWMVMIDLITAVEVDLTVVVEGVIERQEQADEIFEGGKVVR